MLCFLLKQNFNCCQEFFESKDTLRQIFNLDFCKKHQHFKINFYFYLKKKKIPVFSYKTKVLVKSD